MFNARVIVFQLTANPFEYIGRILMQFKILLAFFFFENVLFYEYNIMYVLYATLIVNRNLSATHNDVHSYSCWVKCPHL
jgi:hypothetical protein